MVNKGTSEQKRGIEVKKREWRRNQKVQTCKGPMRGTKQEKSGGKEEREDSCGRD